MPHRTRRTLVLVAVLVVACLAVVLVVLRLGRTASTTSRPSTVGSSMTPTATSSLEPTYAPTDASGSPEPGLAVGDAAAAGGGRATGPSGLPLGYPRDKGGAASAATNYLTWMNSLRIVDKSAADAMAEAAASDGSTKAALEKSFDQLRGGMGGLTVDEVQPTRGAYALASYGPSRAVVYVWAPEVTTDQTGKTDQLWSIDAVALVWADSDWKLDGGLISQAGGAAVDPVNPAGNPTSAEKHAILSRTPADPGDITDAAEQTWFEYANAAR